MPGRGFLDPARDMISGSTPYHWRAAAIHAYYAIFLECRDALSRWGFQMPRRDNVHAWVRLRFIYAADLDLKQIGRVLDELVQLRNIASYHLSPVAEFATPTRAQDAIQKAANALALLDHLDADPGSQATARAAIRP